MHTYIPDSLCFNRHFPARSTHWPSIIQRETYIPDIEKKTAVRWKEGLAIRSFHSIHNVADRCVLKATWEELARKVGGHRDQLIICQPRLPENALLLDGGENWERRPTSSRWPLHKRRPLTRRRLPSPLRVQRTPSTVAYS